jgi:two-component system, OmpR family, phosphate regulon response regulator PhoB
LDSGAHPAVRFLVVEDDPDVRDTVCVVLETLFPEAVVTAAYDKPTFEAAFGQGSWSLIVADLMLPDISGMEICRKVRSEPGGDKVPILAMTGYDTEDMKKKVMASGATAYLPKPFEMDDFVATVKKLVVTGVA